MNLEEALKAWREVPAVDKACVRPAAYYPPHPAFDGTCERIDAARRAAIALLEAAAMPIEWIDT